MRKIIWVIFTTISFSLLFMACNNGESYADKLKKEKKEIEKFLSENDIRVLDTYPGDNYKFAENEYFKDPSGTYIRVINWGNRDYMATATPKTTSVVIKFDNTHFLGDTTIYSTTKSGMDFYSMEIEYGDPATYVGSYNGAGGELFKSLFMSVPCTIPLAFVGDKGEVSLIVPFVNGSLDQRSNSYKALYYGMMRYVLKD